METNGIKDLSNRDNFETTVNSKEYNILHINLPMVISESRSPTRFLEVAIQGCGEIDESVAQ